MADEYTPYLDPSYIPDLGSMVDVYVAEGIGSTFEHSFGLSEIELSMSYALFSGTTSISSIQGLYSIEPFELTISVG